MVVEQARGLFDVQEIDQTAVQIDQDISLLWLIHPAGLSEDTLYAIDQYLLAGGKALIFVDPLAEAAPGEPMAQGMPPQPGTSTLGKIFEAWGLEFLIDQVVLDPIYALSVSGADGQPTKHPGIIGATDQAIDSDDIITAELETVNVSAAGYLSLNDQSSLLMQPLISSSDGAEAVESMLFQFSQDPQALFDQFDGNGAARVIAARLSGPIKTAFPEGRPASVENPEPGSQPVANDDSPEHLLESVIDTQMVVVADVDFLSDRLWVQVQDFFGQRIPSAFADNGNFVINALDNLTGSADLISVRSRGTANRPFTLVEEMRVSAEAQYRETEQSLQTELTGLEQRLGDLQSNRQEGSDTMSFTPQQEVELDRFLQERSRIRTELRAVRRNLDQDIDRLGTLLKAVNIGFVPLLILLIGVMVHFGKRSARSNA
jgi:ABC-type uncharacterized transport system involved in gliding motility auxiliary subunit